MDQFVACFEGLEDPRTGNAGLHDLHELLVIALCTVLSGGQGATHKAAFAAAKEPFVRGFLKLENGLPSDDTFSRLFRLLDPEQFRTVFQRFMAGFAKTVQGVVAIDGKVLRRSFDRARASPCEGARGVSHLIPISTRVAVRDELPGTVPYLA